MNKILFAICSVIVGLSLSSCGRYISTGHGYGYYNRRHSSNTGYIGLKALRIPPVDHYVITSPFGYRYHPIKHRMILHTGVDYATKHNTPIHATAQGILIFKGWKNGYGNTVMIKHNHTYSTLYAHMDHFPSNIRKGDHVRKNQVIGYVGKTGYATGYHVHYEIQKNGKPINPRW